MSTQDKSTKQDKKSKTTRNKSEPIYTGTKHTRKGSDESSYVSDGPDLTNRQAQPKQQIQGAPMPQPEPYYGPVPSLPPPQFQGPPLPPPMPKLPRVAPPSPILLRPTDIKINKKSIEKERQEIMLVSPPGSPLPFPPPPPPPPLPPRIMPNQKVRPGPYGGRYGRVLLHDDGYFKYVPYRVRRLKSGFARYYDNISDMYGFYLFFCCYNSWNKCNNVLRCCKDGIGFPIYMWILFFVLFLLMLMMFILLGLRGARVI